MNKRIVVIGFIAVLGLIVVRQALRRSEQQGMARQASTTGMVAEETKKNFIADYSESAGPAKFAAMQFQNVNSFKSRAVLLASPAASRGSSLNGSSPIANSLAALADSAPDRFLIKNSTISVEVTDSRKAHDLLVQTIQSAKGYVSNLNETVDGLGSRSINVTVRVPSDSFDRSMAALSTLGRVLNKQVTAEDITEEYVDSQARVRNLKSTEERLLTHLSRTGKLPDTLLVEKEITRVRQEIEQLQGRLRFLTHRIEFSTISVTLAEAARAQSLVPAATFSTGKEATDASRSLIEFLRGIWSQVIWVGVWSVVWLPLGLIALVVGRKMWKQWVSSRNATGAIIADKTAANG